MNKKNIILAISIKSIMIAAILTVMLGTVYHFAENTHAEESQDYYSGWQFDGYGWWYQYEDGSYPVYCWAYIDDHWYHFDSFGYMQTGWVWDGSWYFLGSDGTMQTGWVWDQCWYYLYPDGTMALGWVYDGTGWYYITYYGGSYTGWLWDGAWYYFGEDGRMQTGWIKVNDYWFYMGDSGAMQTGWVRSGSNWYYMDEWGYMYTGWLYDNGYWYYLQPGGIMATGWTTDGSNWYYMDKAGRMLTGVQVINGVEYVFLDNGAATLVPSFEDNLLAEDVISYIRDLINRLTTSDMTREQKLMAAFHYIASRSNYGYAINRVPYYTDMDWPAVYTRDMMYRGTSSCQGYAALFGYAAALCGYDNVYWVYNQIHAWVEIDGKVYDTMALEAQEHPVEVFGWSYEDAKAYDAGIGYFYFYDYPPAEGTYQYIRVPQLS